MTTQTNTIRNGQSIRLNVPPGDSVAVVAVSGTYNASIVQGANIGAIATAATGATYGPYADGTVIDLTASAASEIDFAVDVSPVIVSDTVDTVTIGSTGLKTYNIGATAAALVGFHGVAATAQASPYTQTYATASKTHANLTSTVIAAADAANAAAATATAIAANVPAEPPNVDEDGIAAGGFITRAARRALVQTVIDLRTHAVEMDLDYEALRADVEDIRTKYAAAVTLANELKRDHDALLVDVTNLKQVVNAIIDDLQAKGLAA